MRPLNLPESPKNEVLRRHLLDGLTYQASHHSVVHVSGKQNVGKTQLLAQFYAENHQSTVAAFVTGASFWGYDYETIVEDLCQQVRAITGWNGLKLGVELDTASARWRAAVHELSRWARANKSHVNFVLDGLDEIPESAEASVSPLFALLPLGLGSFRVFVSGDRALELVQNSNIKTYGGLTVLDFTLEETRQYLSDFLSADEAAQVYSMSKGLPGYCARIRKLFEVQGSLPDGSLPQNLEKVFEFEWSQVAGNDDAELLVAFVCVDRQKPTLVRLAQLMSIETNSLRPLVVQTSFLEVKDEIVVFATDSLRTFCSKKVARHKKRCLDRIIELSLSDNRSDDSILHLPILLSESGRHRQVIEYLNEDYIMAALERRRAGRFIQEQTILGLRAASKDQRPVDIIRFGLHGANLDAVYLDEHWTTRLRAYGSLGDESSALAIARAFHSPEDRLQGLCTVARAQKFKRGKVGDDLLEEIRREHGLLDKDHLGNRAYDIAQDLVGLIPSLALDVVKRAGGSKWSDTQKYAPPAESEPASNKDDPEKCAASALEILRSRITDPEVRSFSRALIATSRGQTSEQVLAEVASLENDKEKGYFLRVWLSENKKHAGRLEVIRFALAFARSSTQMTPTPAFYLDVVRAVRGLPDSQSILSAVRAQAPLLKKIGPSADYYRLMIYVVEIEALDCKIDVQAEHGLIATEAAKIDDLALRAFVSATRLLSLHRLKENGTEWVNKQHYQDAISILDDSVEKVISSTADHYQCLKRTVSTLARYDCAHAHSIVERINTQERRDRAFADTVFHAIVNRIRGADIKTVGKSFEAIRSPHLKAQCLIRLLEELGVEKRDVALHSIHALESWCSIVIDPHLAAHAWALFGVVLIKYTNKKPAELGWVRDRVQARIEAIGNPILKVETMYELCALLSDYDSGWAKGYLEQAEAARVSLFVRTRGGAACLTYNVDVCIRAFAGLIPRRAYEAIHLKQLVALIEKIPDIEGQVSAFGELAVRFSLGGDGSGCQDIVSRYLLPLINNVPEAEKLRRDALIMLGAPALYRANPVAFLSKLEGIDLRNRDLAVMRILKVIISKIPPDEPEWEQESLPDEISAQSIEEILKLIAYYEDDGPIVSHLELVTLHLQAGRHRFTRAEVEEIRSQVERIVSTRLPTKNFVAHNGYQLLGEAYVLAVRSAKGPEWEQHIDKARKVPNMSDRCLLLTSFAELLGGKLHTLRSQLLEEAIELAEKIPVQYDRAERLLIIAKSARGFDRLILQRAVGAVLKVSASTELDERSMDLKRHAVDLMYIESEVAANKLVSDLSDEMAKQVKREMEKRLKFLELQKRIAERRVDDVDLKAEQDLPEAFWRNLQRLNSGKIEAPSYKQLAPLFAGVEGRAISEVYPILSFGIESCVRNYSKTDEAFALSRKLFEACLHSAQILLRCLAQHCDHNPASASLVSAPANDGRSLIVRKGERKAACDFLRSQLSGSPTGRIVVIDSYFTAEELDLIALLHELHPSVPILIMTGLAKIQQVYGDGSRGAFAQRWNNLCETDCDVRVHVIGKKGTGEAPIHERMILLDRAAVKMGGSWNGIGGERETDIRVMDEGERQNWAAEVDKYVVYMQRLHAGSTLEYNIFSL